jgi:two-component system cell cycle sensor histidine kinase/response regulator CckA
VRKGKEEEQMGRRRILIAENERIIAEDIKSALASLGHSISSVASTGEETVKKAQEEKPDLVLMDIALQGEVDGIEATQLIHEKFNIPVVFFTTYANEGALARAKITKPYAHVAKPLEDRELGAAVEMALSRYEMETRLRESERFSSSLLSNSPYPIMVINPDTSVRYVNPALEKLTGFSAEELIGIKPPYPWWTKESFRKTKRYFRRAMRSGAQRIEERFQKKSGERFWVEITSMPVEEGGEFDYYLSNWVDITKRKQAEETLRESEAQKNAILDASLDKIRLSGPDMRIIWANQTHATKPNRAPEHIVGKACYEVFFGRNSPCPECPSQSALKSGKIEHTVLTRPLLGNMNQKKFLDAYAVPIEDESGHIVNLLQVTRDITEQRQAQEALKESEEKYRLLVENANDAIFIVQDDVVKFPNPKAEEMIGYCSDELARISFANFIHPEDRDVVLERYNRQLKGEKLPGTYAFRIIQRTGEELWVQLNPMLINWEGRPATLNFIRDITQQKKLEVQLMQAQKMEAIGTLAGGIAHDFNNLLMGILGYTSLMLMDLDPSHPHYERLRGIEGLVQSGAELTRQLLGFARGGKYEVKPVDVNELLEKTSDMFGRTKKEITIHRKHQRDIWPIEADPVQIEQVLLNLYVNAWQAMPGGGELYLETENVTLDEHYQHLKSYYVKAGRYVKISVTDTGVGMDEATRQRIFEPFFTTKQMGRGTGLGLASVYGIIKNHDGCITVYSEKGKGASFFIYLPASEKEVTKEKRMPEMLVKGTETVLLVDDERVVIEIAEEMLKALGYTVHRAANGREALEVYEKEKGTIDVVILDMIMPEMGGGEVYDRLKEINPTVKVLLSSGYSIDGQAAEILQRGCNGFIQKPFDFRQLSRKIREVLDEK